MGSFLLSRLRHWVEEHQLQSYPLSRAVLLLLEAQLVLEPSPEAASCLLHAVLKCSNVAADVRCASCLSLSCFSAFAARDRQAPLCQAPSHSCCPSETCCFAATAGLLPTARCRHWHSTHQLPHSLRLQQPQQLWWSATAAFRTALHP